ncbi:hypothetical protein BGY98DRAFT_933236 [Russula aff. rugulosa BPL654]|nr:hypothetical protein BGY98DRAFT_933236 [Russula aff. rugulosa BPL654]
MTIFNFSYGGMINLVLKGQRVSHDVQGLLRPLPAGTPASAMVAKSNKLRFTERCREGEPGQRRAERDTALYFRDPGGLFQEARERSDEVSYGEMSSRCSISLSVWELNDTNNPPQLPGVRFKEIDDRLSSNVHDLSVHTKQEGVVQDDSYEDNYGRDGTVPGLMLGPSTNPSNPDNENSHNDKEGVIQFIGKNTTLRRFSLLFLPAPALALEQPTLIAIADRACTYVPADKYQSRTRRESRIIDASIGGGGGGGYGYSERSDSRRERVYAAMEASDVVTGDVFWSACEPVLSSDLFTGRRTVIRGRMRKIDTSSSSIEKGTAGVNVNFERE